MNRAIDRSVESDSAHGPSEGQNLSFLIMFPFCTLASMSVHFHAP